MTTNRNPAPAIGENKVSQALKALISPDELSTEDQELYFVKLAESCWTPSATEHKVFPDLKDKCRHPLTPIQRLEPAMLTDPPPDIERKPLSEFFKARFGADGELDWVEIRALASIGAGLLTRHLGDPKAIKKLVRLAVPFDGYYHNATAKAMATLVEDAAGGPFDLTEQDWANLAKLAGYKPEEWEQLLAECRRAGC